MSKLKKFWWALALVAIIFIVIALLARAGVINKGILGKQNQTAKAETVIPVKTVTFKDKVIEHEAKLITMQNTIDDLSLRLEALETCCNSKTANSSSYKKVVPTNQGTTNKSSSTWDKRPEEETLNILPIPKDGKPSTANLDYLRQPDGKILLCFRANGLDDHFFPQFAIDRGVTFTSSVSNIYKNGSNLEVEPTKEMVGDVGVTFNGLCYIKASILSDVLKTNGETVKKLEILMPFTKWQPKEMVLLGDYWAFETQRP